MTLGKTIHKIRTEAKLTQEQFSQIFGISQQSVQKWESGQATPDLEKIILISKYFDVSLDALILGNDNRVVEEMAFNKNVKKRSTILPYQWGVWITSYAMSNLFELGSCCKIWLYSDTDSVYGIGWDKNKVKKYNKKLAKKRLKRANLQLKK